MLKQFFSGNIDAKAHVTIFKSLLLICTMAALAIYGMVHLIFFDFPLEVMYELETLTKLLLTASTFAIIIRPDLSTKSPRSLQVRLQNRSNIAT